MLHRMQPRNANADSRRTDRSGDRWRMDTRKPRVLGICSAQGSGKLTIAGMLAKRMPAGALSRSTTVELFEEDPNPQSRKRYKNQQAAQITEMPISNGLNGCRDASDDPTDR
jgi:pantothenate kinase-related protein Tda10